MAVIAQDLRYTDTHTVGANEKLHFIRESMMLRRRYRKLQINFANSVNKAKLQIPLLTSIIYSIIKFIIFYE